MKNCTYCGKEHSDEATICELDGQPLDWVKPDPKKGEEKPVIANRENPSGVPADENRFEPLNSNGASVGGKKPKPASWLGVAVFATICWFWLYVSRDEFFTAGMEGAPPLPQGGGIVTSLRPYLDRVRFGNELERKINMYLSLAAIVPVLLWMLFVWRLCLNAANSHHAASEDGQPRQAPKAKSEPHE